MKLALWNDFCQKHRIFGEAVPLFDSTDGVVSVFPYGRNDRFLLKRSPPMDAYVVSETRKVLQDYESGADEYEGLIYMMFWNTDGKVLPLYIGKSEKLGRKGSLSANIKDIEHNTGKFCRWGYNYAYHIGDLSAVVCPGHPTDKKTPKYRKWAERLFESSPTDKPRLKRDTCLWIKAWKRGTIGIWNDYGETSLTFLEYLLIGVASNLFPEILLNSEGVNRP